MLPDHLIALSQTAACLLLLVLAIYFYRPWREGSYSLWFVIASLVTAWWTATLGDIGQANSAGFQLLLALHYGLWCSGLLSTRLINIKQVDLGPARHSLFIALAFALIAAGGLAPYHLASGAEEALTTQAWSNIALALIACVIAGLLLHKTVHHAARASIFLALGCLMFFVFDLLLNTYAVVTGRLDTAIASWRPAAHLVAAFCLIFATMSTPRNTTLTISRNAVFYGAGTILLIIFLLSVAALSYFSGAFGTLGGQWIAASLLAIAAAALLVLFASRRWRAKLHVFVNKHFFMHKYDYRSEWLKLINILSQPSATKDEKAIALQAAMEVFHADSADLWLLNDSEYNHVASTTEPFTTLPSVGASSHLCMVLESEWVLHPYGRRIESRQHNTTLPSWVLQMESVWVVAPLISQQTLVGFIILCKDEGSTLLTWEDLDVLKTVGRQLGSYLALQGAAQQLSQSEQFDTYNKLTAFIMHDLKNLIAQQALVVENAKKHKENPAFVEDAIKTIENSVGRMSKLLSKLQQRGPGSARTLLLNDILLESVNKCRDKRPVPSLRLNDLALKVSGDHDHLVMIFSHVIKNAQEATAANGFVDVFLDSSNEQAVVRVEDNGQGMSQDFIEQRLFKPFDTTKSGQGMGIGVFQTREYIRSLGGDVQVHSSEGIGSTFNITLPTVKELDYAGQQ